MDELPDTSVDLYCLPISVEALRATPPKARRIYLLAGHISNEINELHRLAIMQLRVQGHPAIDRIANGRGWVILRVLIGKTYEAFQFIRDSLGPEGDFYRDYLAEPIADDKSDVLCAEDRGSYERVWKRIEARRGLLSTIRNTYAFHYKLNASLDKGLDTTLDQGLDIGLEGVDSSWDMSTYSACNPANPDHHSRHAGFHGSSEHAVIRAMLAHEGQADLVAAMEGLRDEVLDAAGEILDCMALIMVSILIKHDLLGGKKGYRILRINGVPSLGEFQIPPILRD